MKKTIGEILLRVLPIMLGVYLGFALNNFGANQKLKKQAATFKAMLKNELQQNLESVQGVRPYHQQLVKDFAEILQAEDIEQAFNDYSLKGLKPGFVNSSAYETGIQTGIIQQFDLTLVQQLNRLYMLQKRYTNFNENMINALSSRQYPDTEHEIRGVIRTMRMNMNDVNSFEGQLAEFYEGMLEIL